MPAPRSSPEVSSSTLPSSRRVESDDRSSTYSSANRPPFARLARRTSRTLSAVGNRPGTTALALILGGTLGLTQPAVLAGLGAAMGATAGLAAGALFDANAARRPDRTAGFVIPAVLVGTFAVHLADGYFAN